jgi:hypothetical protein
MVTLTTFGEFSIGHAKDIKKAHNRFRCSNPCIASLHFSVTSGVRNLGRLIKNNYSNIAQLKDLMTIPPMTAEQHAAVMRKRIEHRRMIEEAKELKSADEDGLLLLQPR